MPNPSHWGLDLAFGFKLAPPTCVSPDYVPITQNPVYPIWSPLHKNMIPEGYSKRGIFEDVLKGMTSSPEYLREEGDEIEQVY